MKKIIFLLVFAFTCAWVSPLRTAMTGGDFIIVEDGFSFVESVTSTGGTYDLLDFGAYTPGGLSGDDYDTYGGFLFPNFATLSLDVSTSTINLGTLSTSATSSDRLTLTVTTDSETGYAVSITEDGNLRSGANDINDVADSLVSAGSEEYGIHTTPGTHGLLDSDTAINGTVNVMSYGGPASGAQTDVTFTASISGSTVAGTYSHIVTFTATVNP